ncbi:hypothetical protein Hte_005882 [Hypoxylon texense]
MDDDELRLIVKLEWRLNVPFIFCARQFCHHLIRNSSAGVSLHLRERKCRRPDSQIDLVVRTLESKNALEPEWTGPFKAWLYHFKLARPVKPFPMLPTVGDAYSCCGYCAYAVKAPNKVKEHCKKEHPGRPAIFGQSPVQVLQYGRSLRYIQVTQPTAVTVLTAGEMLAMHLEDAVSGADGMMSADGVVSAVGINQEPNRWLERMGFIGHFEGYDLALIASMVDREGSPELSSVVEHLRNICFRAAARIATDAAGNDTLLVQLNRRTSSDSTMQTFNWDIQHKSLVKYIKTWTYILVYVEYIYCWSHDSEPPCRLTEPQRMAFSNAISLNWDQAAEYDKDAVVFDLVWYIVNHQLRRSTFDSVLVSACAAFAVDPNTLSWRTGKSYNSTHFSAVIKIVLFVIYLRAITAVDEQIDNKTPRSWTRMLSPTTQFADDLDAITKSMDGVIYVRETDSHSTPITWAMRAQVIAKEDRMCMQRPPVVEWGRDGQLKLIAGGTVTSTDTLAELMTVGIEDVRESLYGLLLQRLPTGSDDGRIPAPVPDLDHIQDDRSQLTPGYSFLDHPDNEAWVAEAASHLLTRIDLEPELKKEWCVGNVIDRTVAKAYESTRKKFLLKLAVAIHLTAGQPSRRTEQQILRWTNSPQGGLRNLVVCNGRVGLRSIWFKRRWTARGEVPIWRFLPPVLSQMVIVYISTVLPFSKCLHRYLGAKGNLSYFLYSSNLLYSNPKDIKLIDEQALLSRPFGELTVRVLGYRMTIAQYRHVSIAYARRFMHNQSMGVILGLDAAAEEEDEDDDQPSKSRSRKMVNVTHAQAAHSTGVADMVYAVEYDTSERFNRFFEASLHWHLLFRLHEDRRAYKDNSDKGAAAARPERVEWLSLLSGPATDKSLQTMMRNNHVRLRQHQREFLESAVKDNRVVYVAGAGAGKSTAVALLSYLCPSGCTVLIQSSKALRRTTHDWLSSMGIGSSIWDGRGATIPTSVILVSPEALESREWGTFLQRQRVGRGIDRVVLEDAYEILLSRSGAQSNYLGLYRAMDAVCPRQVFVASILPPSLQDLFLSRLKLEEHEDRPCILRYQTARDNLRYHYVDADFDSDVPQVVCDMISKVSSEGRRAVVLSMSKETCDMVATELHIPAYSAEMSWMERQRALSRWGSRRCALSATASYIEGIEFDEVALVICLGHFDYLSLCQQFAKICTAGNLAVAVLVCPLSDLPRDVRPFATSTCHREAVTSYLDGKGVSCGFQHNTCNLCRGRFYMARP